MSSSKTNSVKALAISVALFVLPLMVTSIFKADVKAAATYPTGDMHEPPAITELIPDDDPLENSAPKEDTLVGNTLILGDALNAAPIETGEHYRYLSPAEKAIYSALYRSIVSDNFIPYSQRTNTYTWDCLNTYKTLVYSGSSTFQNAYDLSTKEYENVLNRAQEALYFDHPEKVEFYMCHTSYYWSKYESGNFNSYIVITANYDESAFENIDSQITTALNKWISDLKNPSNNCVNQTWDALTELNVHDYYVGNLQYDHACAADRSTAGYYNLSHTAYGALVNHLAVCDGYSAGYELILKRLGIESMIIAGYAGGGHAWNIVRLDGSWYEVDTTWAISTEGELRHDWFNRTTAEYEKGVGDSSKAHLRNSSSAFVGFRMPKAYGTHYTYDYLSQTDVNSLIRDEQYVAVTGISLSQSELEMQIGQSIVADVQIIPANATVKDYVVKSSNYDCIEVDEHILRAIAPGEAIITVTSADGGHKAQCKITVPLPEPEKVDAPEEVADKQVDTVAPIDTEKGVFEITPDKNTEVTFKAGNNKKASSITIPSAVTDENGCMYTVTEIEDGACKGYKKLKKVIIPETIRTIGKGAFKNCSNLSVIKIKGNNLLKVGSGAFKGIKKGAKITIYVSTKKKFTRLVKLIKKAGGSKAIFKFKKQ
ncbi:leucine-rich repeat protein [Butyrivibrio sp. WCD2001]|uniref:leucine-rich repeat protein n=1 Tax=Butyrivibrio sp. WCD2001 TaxID=1280681 RepID=UPI000479D377|nr:leucine-rich repeat protein [Butyrivibrio sp. WCD2001]